MRTPLLRPSSVVAAILVLVPVLAAAQQSEPPWNPEQSFYSSTLHATNRGIAYLCEKEQGGLERITGLTADQLGCLQAKCHVRTCDTCHRVDVEGKATFSVSQARSEEACRRCHPVAPDDPDVHFKAGMKCMSCHTPREIHGDGTAYSTYQQPGALETRCETCHGSISRSPSHTVHGGRLDCTPCHARELVTCLNCHVETRIKERKDVQVELKDLFFLVNHEGRVTLGNLLSYVYQDKTMITVAAYFPHSIQKEGRRCAACHGTENVRQVAQDAFTLARFENGAVQGAAGVVPLVEGMRWDLPFLDWSNGTWVPIANPAAPLVNTPFCTLLTREQLAKLERPRG